MRTEQYFLQFFDSRWIIFVRFFAICLLFVCSSQSLKWIIHHTRGNTFCNNYLRTSTYWENIFLIQCGNDGFFKRANRGLFFISLRSSQSNNTNLRQINVKNVHPVSNARIWTHDLEIMILLPKPLNQGSW